MDFKKSLKLDNSSLFNKEQVEQEKYRKKCKRIKRLIKDLVYENGALCDQIAILQEKTLHMIDERNYLFKKLYTYQPLSKSSADSDFMAIKSQITALNSESVQNRKAVPKKKVESTPNHESSIKSGKPAAKKQIPAVKKKKTVKTIALDPAGKPVFPVKLGDISIHCIGEVTDRPLYRNEDVIYPIGYVATRIYGSLKDPEKQCVYTCKIFDGGLGPRFDISIEGESEILSGRSIDELHSGLMERINSRLATQVVSIRGKGAQFFGLKHPVVQSLIQSSSLRHQKLELSGNTEEENEASVSYKSLLRSISFSRSHLDSYPRDTPITLGSILL